MFQGFGGSSTQRHINGQFSTVNISGSDTDVILKVSGGASIKKQLKSSSVKTKQLDVDGNVYANAVYLADPIVNPLQAVTKQYVDNLCSVGDIKYSVNGSDHLGWLICDGRSLDREEFSKLFDVIGTQFGVLDVNHFNLPDCRGRVLGGAGSGPSLTTRVVGDSTGEENHTLTLSELTPHGHSGLTELNGYHGHSVSDPGHTHSQTTINDDFNNSGANPPGFTADSAGSMTWNNINASTTGISVISNGEHNHHFNTDSTGSGNAFNVMQPTLFVNTFIYSSVIPD